MTDQIDQTKEKIIRVTLDLLNDYTIQQLTIDDIAKKSGIDKSFIEANFLGKENLLANSFSFFFNRMKNIFNILNDDNISQYNKLKEFAKGYSNNFIEFPAMLKMQINQMINNSFDIEKFPKEIREGFDKVRNIIGELKNTQDEEKKSFLFVSLISSILYPAIISNYTEKLLNFNYKDRDTRYKYIDCILEKF